MWDFELLSKKYTPAQLEKLANHQPKVKTCPVCATEFDAQSYVFRPTAIYPLERQTCSDGCKRIYGGRKNKRIVRNYVCLSCKQAFVPHKAKPHQQYCTKKCRGELLRGTPRPDVQRWVHKLVPPKGSISDQGTAWLDANHVPLREHVLSVGKRKYRVDGYNPNTNVVYEFLGSFWHGNPAVYKSTDINPVNKKTFGDLYRQTMERLTSLEDAGYVIVYVWSDR
jgi:hypothetical protein